jgi:hypothetical protein
LILLGQFLERPRGNQEPLEKLQVLRTQHFQPGWYICAILRHPRIASAQGLLNKLELTMNIIEFKKIKVKINFIEYRGQAATAPRSLLGGGGGVA